MIEIRGSIYLTLYNKYIYLDGRLLLHTLLSVIIILIIFKSWI